MKHPVIFASDLHGNRYAYDRLFNLAVERGIKTVILGGDLTPKWPVISFYGRNIVPLDPKLFMPDENGRTYDAFLSKLEPIVMRRVREAETHFVKLGGYLVHTGTDIDWKKLRLEQRILRTMIEEFAPQKRIPGRESGTGVYLEAEEFACLEELLLKLSLKPSPLKQDWTVQDILRSVRFRTLNKEEYTAILGLQAAWVERLKQDLEGQPPNVQSCFRDFASAVGSRFGHEGDFQHVEALCMAAAEEHELHKLIEMRRDFKQQVQPQRTFLDQILNRRIRKFQQELPGARVYLILGNDDLVENEAVVKRMHERGAVTLIDREPVELASGHRIVGYPFVKDSGGKFYGGWEKREDEIREELIELETRVGDPEKTVFVVHSPPYLCQLDQSFGRDHFGSVGVREWLRTGKKHLVLSGHIHEAPFMNGGIWRETVDGTPCIQPGGWHDEDLCAVIVDLDDPSDAEWIADRSKVKA